MDTLSSLFSKKIKKSPMPPQFHGINEDLYEGKKLISKRRKTKNKIAQKSPLLEGFANQLDDVTLNEDEETTALNAQLQSNLSSHKGALKGVLSDYVTARAEQAQCVQRCNNLTAVQAAVNKNAKITSPTHCTAYAGTDYAYCPSTGINYCAGVCSDGATCPGTGLRWFACSANNEIQDLTTQKSLAEAAGHGYEWGSIAQNILWQGENSPEACAAACDANPECTAYETCNNGKSGPGCRGCYLINKPSIGPPSNFQNAVWSARSKEQNSACDIDEGLAYLADGPAPTCVAATPEYIKEIAQRTIAMPHGMAFGQQSNGCWHILQWAPNNTIPGADKKTRSMYPKYFAVVRPPQPAQCEQLGQGSADADAEDETELQKEACLAGCKLSEAYLEPTAQTANVCAEGWTKTSNAAGCQWCTKDGHICTINTGKGPCGQAFCTGDVETKKISSCGELGRDCNTVAHWNGCSNSDQCAGPEIFCREGDRRCLTDADCTWANSVDGGNRDCTRIPRSGHCPNSTCADNPAGVVGVGIEADGTNPWVAGESSAWNVNNQKQICVSRGMCFNAWKLRWPGAPDGPWCFEPEATPPDQTINAVAACQQSETANAAALNQQLGGRNLTQEYTDLQNQENIELNDEGGAISSRIANILGLRQELNANNSTLRTDLTSTLSDFQKELKILENTEQESTTIKAMMEQGKLNKRSASYKYYIWLGLAICVLIVAIRQLKK